MITDATAAKTPNGDRRMTKSVTLSITYTSSSIQPTSVVACLPLSDAMANPKKSENTRICRMLLFVIASNTLFGKTWVMKSLRLRDPVLRFVAAPASGNGNARFAPGCSRSTMMRPSPSDTSDARMNQSSAFTPMRPTAAASPMVAMPATSVAKTSGAMIILMSRKKMSVTTLK